MIDFSFAVWVSTKISMTTEMLHPLDVFSTLKMILSFINIALLIILLVLYGGIYKKTKSRYTLSLILFALAMLMYAVTSNPLMHEMQGLHISGLGPFTFIPDLFVTIAIIILIHLTLR